MVTKSILVKCLRVRPEPTREKHYRVGSWPHPQTLDYAGKACTLAYYEYSQITTVKSFITLGSGLYQHWSNYKTSYVHLKRVVYNGVPYEDF